MSEKKKGMKREDYLEALDAVALKRSKGEKLSKREELIYAYRDVGRCKCGVRRG